MEKRGIEILARSPFWLIDPRAILRITSLVPHKPIPCGNGNGNTIVHPEFDAVSVPKPSVTGRGQSKLAIIPIQGVLTKDGPAWFGSNYDTITTALDSAGSDPDVKRIILAVDSPGGEVIGLPETAAVLAQVAKVKPVSAIVEGTAASAAYWLTSQAGDISLTPSGEVGSVGVRMMHVDVSQALLDAGIKVTELYSGAFKAEWSPYSPLTQDAVDNMQPRLNEVHAAFIKAVATGRGGRVSAGIASQRFGEGRMFSATDALKHGLVDKLQSASDFYKAAAPRQAESSAPLFGFPRPSRN